MGISRSVRQYRFLCEYSGKITITYRHATRQIELALFLSFLTTLCEFSQIVRHLASIKLECSLPMRHEYPGRPKKRTRFIGIARLVVNQAA